MVKDTKKMTDAGLRDCFEQQRLLRREVVVLFSKFEYQFALPRVKELVHVSKKLFFENPIKNYYSYLADACLLTKCFLRLDKLILAEKTLEQIWNILAKFFKRRAYRVVLEDTKQIPRYEIDKLERYINSISERTMSEEFSNMNIEQLESEKNKIRSNLLVTREVKKRTALLSTIATGYYNIGNIKGTEKAYAMYVKIIEANFGLESIEASNCYYLVGSFYLENNYLKKAMACFKRALVIRLKQLGKEHLAVADCFYNVGLVLYLAGRHDDAMKWFWNALAVRIQSTGEDNIHVAKIYEVLALIFMEAGDEKNAIEKFKACLRIKHTLLSSANHPEILTVVENLKTLMKKIEMRKKEKEKKMLELRMQQQKENELVDKYLKLMMSKEKREMQNKMQKSSKMRKMFNSSNFKKIMKSGMKLKEFTLQPSEESRNPFADPRTDEVQIGGETARTFGAIDSNNMAALGRGSSNDGIEEAGGTESSQRFKDFKKPALNIFSGLSSIIGIGKQNSGNQTSKSNPGEEENTDPPASDQKSKTSLMGVISDMKGKDFKSMFLAGLKKSGASIPSNQASASPSEVPLLTNQNKGFDKSISFNYQLTQDMDEEPYKKPKFAESQSFSESDDDDDDGIFILQDGGTNFTNQLSEKQVKDLNKLKFYIKEKSTFDQSYHPRKDIVKSNFYRSLPQHLKEEFKKKNKPIFE